MAVRRRLGIVFVGVAGLLVLASVAWACAVLTTLSVDPGRGRPGATISGFGGNYRTNSDPSAPQFSDVIVTLDRRSGRVLATVTPNPDRTIEFTFKVPKVKAGWHTVLATQYSLSDGSPVAGTPGRASLKVRATRRGEIVPVAWGPQRPSAVGNEAPAPLSLPLPAAAPQVLLALALIALMGAGVVVWRRQGARTAA